MKIFVSTKQLSEKYDQGTLLELALSFVFLVPLQLLRYRTGYHLSIYLCHGSSGPISPTPKVHLESSSVPFKYFDKFHSLRDEQCTLGVLFIEKHSVNVNEPMLAGSSWCS